LLMSLAAEEAGVGDALFAPRQVIDDQGPIGPRDRMAVEGVDLAERPRASFRP
jgi:hypothetical protein